MPIELIGVLEDLQPYEGKNGWGANVTISTKVDKRTKRVEFVLHDKEQYKKLEDMLDSDVILKVELNQNNFGMRIGDLLEIGA